MTRSQNSRMALSSSVRRRMPRGPFPRFRQRRSRPESQAGPPAEGLLTLHCDPDGRVIFSKLILLNGNAFVCLRPEGQDGFGLA